MSFVEVSPGANLFANAVWSAVSQDHMVSKLGSDWEVLITSDGRPVAGISRTSLGGLSMRFYDCSHERTEEAA